MPFPPEYLAPPAERVKKERKIQTPKNKKDTPGKVREERLSDGWIITSRMIYTHTHTHKHTCAHTHARTQTHTHGHGHTYAHTHIHTDTHIFDFWVKRY